MTMTVRLATPRDAKGIGLVSVKAWQSAYEMILPRCSLARLSPARRADQVRQAIASGTRYWVAVRDSRIVGFVAAGEQKSQGVRADAEIYAVYVLPSEFGRGTGSALLQTAIRFLSISGYQSLGLVVLRDNLRAKRFYEKCGGTACGMSVYTYEGVDYPEEIYIWPSLQTSIDELEGS